MSRRLRSCSGCGVAGGGAPEPTVMNYDLPVLDVGCGKVSE